MIAAIVGELWPYLLAAGAALLVTWRMGRWQSSWSRYRGLNMQRRNVRVLIASGGLMLLALLGACRMPPTTGTDDVCLIWKPVTYSAGRDSGETITEVREQNAKRDAYCSNRSP